MADNAKVTAIGPIFEPVAKTMMDGIAVGINNCIQKLFFAGYGLLFLTFLIKNHFLLSISF
jgi:hypothetical protein